MSNRKLSDLNEQELQEMLKKAKRNDITNAVLIGVFVGIAFYSSIKNGFGFFTIFPLLFPYFLIKNSKTKKEIEAELNSRKTN